METGATPHAAPAVLSTANGIATITLNRPDVLNALNAAMVSRLHALVAEVETDETIRAVVIHGSGNAFMAGGDIGQFAKALSAENPQGGGDRGGNADGGQNVFTDLLDQVNAIVLTLRRMNKPVLAVVHGSAAGFGVSLALACDMVLASDTASFTPAYSSIGATPDGGITRHLPLAIGRQAAFQLLMLGDTIDARKAGELGLVNRVVPLDTLAEEAQRLASRLAALPTVAIGRTKALLNTATDEPLGDHLAAEARAFATTTASDDFREGVTAFMQKRKPVFTGK